MKTRRDLLKKLGVGAAVGAVGGYSAVQMTSFLEPKHEPSSPNWLFGEGFDRSDDQNWVVSEMSPIERGACIMTLKSKDGESARVHICSHVGQPVGVASSAFLDFVLMDGGDGHLPTNEELGCKILTLARHVLINELKMSDRELNQIDGALAQLETHSIRLDRYKNEGLL